MIRTDRQTNRRTEGQGPYLRGNLKHSYNEDDYIQSFSNVGHKLHRKLTWIQILTWAGRTDGLTDWRTDRPKNYMPRKLRLPGHKKHDEFMVIGLPYEFHIVQFLSRLRRKVVKARHRYYFSHRGVGVVHNCMAFWHSFVYFKKYSSYPLQTWNSYSVSQRECIEARMVTQWPVFVELSALVDLDKIAIRRDIYSANSCCCVVWL